MKFFTNQSNSKKIIISILVVLLFNFISPTISSAKRDIDGGVLFDPIADLLCTIADYIIGGLQDYFIGGREITKTPLPGAEYDEYIITYSPGVIFSGKVASLKTNFINAKSKDKETLKKADYKYTEVTTLDTSEMKNQEDLEELFDKELRQKNYLPKKDEEQVPVFFYYYSNPDAADGKVTEVDLVWTWEYNGEVYQAIMKDAYLTPEDILELGLSGAKAAGIAAISLATFSAIMKIGTTLGITVEAASPITVGESVIIVAATFIVGVVAQVGEWIFTKDTTFEDTIVYKRTIVESNTTKESFAFKLKNTISTWYIALRNIALVGLLSMLMYIGIRILISTTSQEKSKYKKLILDWLVAICLIFVLHYIMLFITEVIQKITDVLAVKLIDTDGRDIFMTGIRQSIELNYENLFINLLMYLVLLVYTIIFTVQYVKRFFYVAFFTMIAPLVALTYPLDKMKDGQAQAFTVWLREYLFNSLLQPMHLLLYYIFVDAANKLSTSNLVYAIVAIGFLLPAEKFFRKMFGFDKAESASQVNAAVGGALVANAITNLARKTANMASKGLAAAGKSGGSGSSGGDTKDTANSDKSADKGKSTPRYASTHKNDNSNKNGSTNSNENSNTHKNNSKTFNQDVNKAAPKGKVNLKNGVKTLAGRYNPLNKVNRKKLLKGTGRLARKTIVGATGAAALGTVGLAIGIATGDASKAFGYGLAGAGTGYTAANNLGDRAAAFEKKNREIYKEGALGTEEYNTRNSINELTNDNDFNKICDELEIKDPTQKEQLIRQFHSNGITSSADIKKSMSVRSKTGASQEEVIAAYKIKERAEADKLERDDIIKRLTRQGVKDEGENKRLSRAMEIIDKFYD